MGEYKKHDGRLWLGLIFIIVGAVWLLDNLNIIPYWIPDAFYSFWSILVLVGIYLIFGKKKVEPGIIMVAIGSFFILRDIYWWVNFRDIMRVFWPALAIIIGTMLILRRRKSSDDLDDFEKKNSIDYIDDFAIFGGRDMLVDSQNFKGGKVTAIFGGSTIDLTGANIAPGHNVIDVFALFGGTSIIVPPDWTVHIDATAILGGFSDKRVSALKVVPNPEKVLIIKGFVMFGGGDLKFNR